MGNITLTDTVGTPMHQFPTSSRELSIRQELKLIIDMFKTPIGPHPEDMLEQLDVVMAWSARVGELYAEAKRVLDGQMGNLMEELARADDIPWGALKAIIDGKTKEERYDMTLADRTSAMLAHYTDALRTKISYEKSLMENSQRQ